MWHQNAYMKYDVFSANPSISSTGLKSLDVVKGKENGVGLGGTGSDGGERDRTGRECDRTRGNRIKLGRLD